MGPKRRGYLKFTKALCTACTQCVRACPTEAIRIRDRKSVRMVSQCIGCGECIRVCPTGAISAATAEPERLTKEQHAVAIITPVLYSQFPGVMPAEVIKGLGKLGFQYALDMFYYLEMFQCAVEETILRNRLSRRSPWPLISSYCPVVNHLIAVKFPSLLPHLLPIIRPVTLMARETRINVSRELKVAPDKVTIYHITANSSSFPHEQADIDHVLGINDVFAQLKNQINKQNINSSNPADSEDAVNSLQWSLSGGEIAGINIERSLAVSGLRETIAYLEKIDMGMFGDLEYMELRTCPEGCVGGSLVAVDRHLAKSAAQKLIRRFNPRRKLSRQKILRLFEKGRFNAEISPATLRDIFADSKRSLSIKMLSDIDALVERISGIDCAACGAPDCRTFAEDVIRGKAKESDCLFLAARDKLKNE